MKERACAAMVTPFLGPPWFPDNVRSNLYTLSGPTWSFPIRAVLYPAWARRTGSERTVRKDSKWCSACSSPYCPEAWVWRPVRITERLGLQLAVVNYARKLDGVQIGVLNIIKEGGFFPVMVIANWTKK